MIIHNSQYTPCVRQQIERPSERLWSTLFICRRISKFRALEFFKDLELSTIVSESPRKHSFLEITTAANCVTL